MDPRVPGMHHPGMDLHYRESPVSLCSSCGTCSSRFNNPHIHPVSAPSLPPSSSICNCTEFMTTPHTMSHHQQPHFCNNINSSISQHMNTSAASPLTLSHMNSTARSSPTQVHTSIHHTMTDQRHMTCPLHQHQMMAGVTNQRYTTSTLSPDQLHNQTTDSNSNTKANVDSSRSLSPFAFLRKHNRDSKASTNNMLDNSSSKSLLMCNRKLLVAVVLTLVLILILSVAVGLVVTFAGKLRKHDTQLNWEHAVLFC